MLRLRDIMTRDVFSAAPDMTIRDAMELLSERHVSGAPVVDGGKVVGIFSATDLLVLLAELNDTTPSLTFRRRRGRTAIASDEEWLYWSPLNVSAASWGVEVSR